MVYMIIFSEAYHNAAAAPRKAYVPGVIHQFGLSIKKEQLFYKALPQLTGISGLHDENKKNSGSDLYGL